LQKAYRDLLSARILLAHSPPIFDTACFHCQQAAEKALKAFLVWQAVPFEKVHSLTYLLDLCEAQEPGFTLLRERADTLAPYAVDIRYPSEAMAISPDEAQEALATAEALWTFVLAHLPPHTYPPSQP